MKFDSTWNCEEEEGFLKRGPKAYSKWDAILPFDKKRLIVALAIDSISERRGILKGIVNEANDEEKQAFEIMEKLVKIAHFAFQYLRDMSKHIVKTN